MNAMPCYNDLAIRSYLQVQDEAEKARNRLLDQVADELSHRETWECGMAEAAIEQTGQRNPILDALITEDFAEAGRLIHRYITERYAVEAAEVSIHKQDEDAENDFLIG